MSDEKDADELLQAVNRMEQRIDRLWHMVTLDTTKLWDTSSVGAYFGISESQVRLMVKGNPSFPPEVKTETNGKQSQPRWNPDEVKAWALRPEHRVSRAS